MIDVQVLIPEEFVSERAASITPAIIEEPGSLTAGPSCISSLGSSSSRICVPSSFIIPTVTLYLLAYEAAVISVQATQSARLRRFGASNN
jgi:hypothetical protein